MIQISNSKIKTYRRCPNQYRYKYVLGLKPKRRKIQLERGSWLHELLMVDADGHDWKERHKLLTKQFYNLWEEEREDLGDLPAECARIMRSYKRRYKGDERRWFVVDTEIDEEVTLPNGVRMRVIVDVVLEDMVNGGLWPKDYKTRKSFDDMDNMMRSPQLTLYYKALEMLGYEDLRGVIYDELRTKAPTVPAVLKSGGLSKAKSIDTDVYTYLSEIRKKGLDPNDYADILRLIAVREKDKFFRRTMLPKDPPVIRTQIREAMMTAQSIIDSERRGHFPRVDDKSCSWQCDFSDLCIAELYGGNIGPMIKQNFTRRTPKKEDA